MRGRRAKLPAPLRARLSILRQARPSPHAMGHHARNAPQMPPKRYLIAALLALALLYAVWFARDPHVLAALMLFALPPGLLAASAALDWKRAGFTAAVLALLWFSHGVMLVWAEPTARLPAGIEILLSLTIIHAACLPGMRARRAKRASQANHA